VPFFPRRGRVHFLRPRRREGKNKKKKTESENKKEKRKKTEEIFSSTNGTCYKSFFFK